MTRKPFLVLGLALFSGSTAWAIPQTLNFQGFLKESGSPVTATRDMTFNIYNVQSGGSSLFTEAHTGANTVTVSTGVFNAIIGDLTSGGIPLSVFDGGVKYVEVSVGATTLPRQKITSVGNAFFAATASALTSNAAIQISSAVLTATGPAQYSLQTSSGINVQAGGVTAPFFSGSFVGSGAGLTGLSGTDSSKVAKAGDAMTGPLTMLSGSTITVTGNAFSVGGLTLVVAGGNVGIGTANPSSPLVIKDVSTGPNVYVGFSHFGSTMAVFGQSANGSVFQALALEGTPLILNHSSLGNTIINDAGGNVGIGTAGPSEKLHVSGGNLIVDSLNGIGWGSRRVQLAGDTTVGASYIRFDSANLERMRLIDNGFFGIGTTIPGRQLSVDVGGAAYISSFSALGNTLQTYADSSGPYQFSGGGAIGAGGAFVGYGTVANKLFTVGAGGYSKFAIDNGLGAITQMPRISSQAVVIDGSGAGLTVSGNVGIGTASPATKFHMSSGTLTVDGTAGAINVAGGSVTASAFFGDGSHLTGVSGTDSNKVAKAGDTMTGQLTLTGSSLTVGGYVGINGADATAASSPLNVKIATGKEIGFAMVGTTQTILGTSTNGAAYAALGLEGFPLQLNASNGQRVLIAPNAGNVGIGTVSPLAKLDVGGTSGALLTAGITANDYGANYGLGVSNSNGLLLSKIGATNNANRVISFNRDDVNGASLTGFQTDGATPGYAFRANNSGYYTGGNFGIGTTSPSERLRVSGGNFAMDNDTGIGWGARNAQFVGSDAAGASYLRFDTAALERMRIINNGNVGIGTASPGYILVASSTVNGDRLRIYNSNAAGGTATLELQNDVQVANRAWALTTNYDVGGALSIRTGATQTGSAYLAGSTVMILQNNGNVGIGKTNPAVKLDVAGEIAATSSVTASAFFGDGSHLTGVTTPPTNQADVSASKAANTTYRNTTGKVLYVNVTSNATGSLNCKSDSSSSPTTVVAFASVSTGAPDSIPFSFMVLPGNYYRVEFSFTNWVETY